MKSQRQTQKETPVSFEEKPECDLKGAKRRVLKGDVEDRRGCVCVSEHTLISSLSHTLTPLPHHKASIQSFPEKA